MSWQGVGISRWVTSSSKDSEGNILDTTQPEQMFKFYTDYQLMTRLTLGGSLRWQDDTAADPVWIVGNPDLYNIDSNTVVGANVGDQVSDQLSPDLVINNLLDKEYQVSNYGYSYGAPRNFTLNARYSL